MTKEDFSTRLRVARGRSRLTVDHLSRLSGVSATQIHNIELGRVARPRVQTLAALAEAMNLPDDYFLSSEVAT